jgi:hypothetical protein
MIKKIIISESSRKLLERGCESDLILADKINEIIDYINERDAHHPMCSCKDCLEGKVVETGKKVVEDYPEIFERLKDR